MVESLTRLKPKRLERRLEELARHALPCVSAVVAHGDREQGLTVALWVKSNARRDVLDLARVLESEPGGYVETGWSLLLPSRRHPHWRLLLRVNFQRPVLCDFVVRFGITDHPNDELRLALPLLLAASGFALCTTGPPSQTGPSPGCRRRSRSSA